MNVAKSFTPLYLLLLLSIVTGCSEGSTASFVDASGKIEARQILSGLAVPWGMVFISDDEILVTERPGTVKKLNLSDHSVVEMSGVPPVVARGQGGLLDIALSPDYSQNGWLYLTYAKPVEGGAATTLARARLQGSELVDFQELFVSNHHSDRYKHFGSRITFDGKGHLFFGHGERGNRPSAQDLEDHGGSILRLNLDGSIPDDNPFVGASDARPEIWSYGHRNPQGLFYDRVTSRLWEIEHGPRGGDEINLVTAGANYGWPVISYGKEYTSPRMVGEGTHRKGMEQPVKYYVPSIAPSSLIVYTGDYYPGWHGNLLIGALAEQHLNLVVLDDAGRAIGEKRYLTDLGERIRNVVEAPDGKVYVATDSGKLMVLLNR